MVKSFKCPKCEDTYQGKDAAKVKYWNQCESCWKKDGGSWNKADDKPPWKKEEGQPSKGSPKEAAAEAKEPSKAKRWKDGRRTGGKKGAGKDAGGGNQRERAAGAAAEL